MASKGHKVSERAKDRHEVLCTAVVYIHREVGGEGGVLTRDTLRATSVFFIFDLPKYRHTPYLNPAASYFVSLICGIVYPA